MYKVKLKEACKVGTLNLKAGQLVKIKKSAVAKELCDNDKAVLISGKFKQVKPKKQAENGTN